MSQIIKLFLKTLSIALHKLNHVDGSRFLWVYYMNSQSMVDGSRYHSWASLCSFICADSLQLSHKWIVSCVDRNCACVPGTTGSAAWFIRQVRIWCYQCGFCIISRYKQVLWLPHYNATSKINTTFGSRWHISALLVKFILFSSTSSFVACGAGSELFW